MWLSTTDDMGFKIMTRLDQQELNDPYWFHKTAVIEYIADDWIWFWDMGTACVHDKCIHCGEVLTSAHDIASQNILHLGIYDWTPEDRRWDNSTHSMRYTAMMGD